MKGKRRRIKTRKKYNREEKKKNYSKRSKNGLQNVV
jgi:hypothetical protein